MNQFWPALFAGLAVVITVAAWKPVRKRVQTWWANQMDAADYAEELEENDQLETLREQVAQRARKLGIPMPVSSSGNRVEYADGRIATFIPDHRTYRAAMEARRVDIFNTYNRELPIPLSRRDRSWLMLWLEEHPEL